MTYRTALLFLMALLISVCFEAPGAFAEQIRKPVKSINDIHLPPIKDIPRQFISEMNDFYKECTDNPFDSGHRDCKCYSMSYLQERLLMPSVSPATILNMISQDCFDETETAGYYYRACYNLNVRTDIRDWEMICSCFGNQMAKSITLFDRLDFMKLTHLQSRAYSLCGY